jgi:hypothetical protein
MGARLSNHRRFLRGTQLFGTDDLKPGQDVPQFKLLAGIDLPADVRTKIERGNAARLLKLSA